MWAMILMAVGTSVVGSGSHVAGDIIHGDPMRRPQYPGTLQRAQIIGFGAFLLGLVGGFFLYGWPWLGAVVAILLVGFGAGSDLLKALARDALPGVAMLAIVLGIATQVAAYLLG